MGLFGKISENMHHGGVKVHVQAPEAIAVNQVIPVIVTITADEAQTINGVKAEIIAERREQGAMNMGMGVGVNNGFNNGFNNGYDPAMNNNNQVSFETIAQTENRDSFTVAPGDTKTVNLQLLINGNLGSQTPQLGGALGALLNAAQAFDHVTYTYSLKASADVADIKLDPSDHQSIQVLPATAAVPTPVQPQAPQAPQPPTTEPPQQTPLPPLPPVPPAPAI